MAATTPDSDRTVPRKSTLFCPDCGHESHWDGDWRVVETAEKRRYVCPDCDTQITSRPTNTASNSRDSEPVWEMWATSVRTGLALWTDSPTQV